MKGFKDFIMRGNLIELAVAFIMAAAFGAVVTAFTKMILDILGKLGGTPDFSSYKPGGISVGNFITALISFLILAFVVYFFIVKPYEMARDRLTKKPEEEPEVDVQVELLKEIRDALKARG
ncbi:Large conductance mechanosensitive channel [Nostocoides japonicum T1-X7]|uniref:Large conductance mechanosensitive channel n=1 Tax=Nostocoides japonicum T1-X7 TaxID=1194083 RepID=A0A077M6N9_9MICO|nr:large conductance mechanosensitive channel protein MscL [Tetrasphaera japonica]CCH79839.1 Large conductance mechanosensitive channel [Tetrasphaera japonica T1-X7]